MSIPDFAPVGGKTMVLLVLVGAVVTAAGFGVVSTLDAGPDQPDVGPATTTTTTTPAPPTVTPGGSDVESTTETTTETTTTATTTASPPELSLTVSTEAFATTVSNANGEAPDLQGDVTGTLSWSGETPARVRLTAYTRLSNGTWREARTANVTVEDEEVSLDAAFPGSVTYRTPGDGFDNPVNGTIVERTGYVAVVASASVDGERVASTRQVDGFDFQVVNEGPDDSDGGGSGGADAGILASGAPQSDPSRPDLVLSGSTGDPTLIDASGVAPGRKGSSSVTATNAGDAPGELSVGVSNVSTSENGFTGPEAKVDDSPHSAEIGEYLFVRVALHRNGETTYLLGGPESMVLLTDVDAGDVSASPTLDSGESATVQVEWALAKSAGNAVQSDSASFDLTVSLSTDTTSPALLASREGSIRTDSALKQLAGGVVKRERSLTPDVGHPT